jgi:HD-GYP domain-containing protein (c-di-GMP phosphodiesterase class II)
MINALLIFKDEALKQNAIKTIQTYYKDKASVQSLSSLQEAVEQLETQKTIFDLILFEQRTPSLTMAKMLFPLGNSAKYIMCNDVTIDTTSIQDYIIEHAPLDALEVILPKIFKKFEVLGYLIPASNVSDEYISVSSAVMASYCPLNYDVYIKMVDGRFVKLFKKGDPIERADFDRYQKEKGIELFYFKKVEYNEILNQTAARLDKIASTVPLPEEVVVKEAQKSHAVVKDIVSQLGFTPEAQSIAKSSVAMTVKLIGTKPKLSKILSDLKKKEGSYISSHSISLGTLSCAIAYKLEWHSAATFFKLSLAAFMHDISLSDKLAQMNGSLKDAANGEYSSDEINKIKLHPVHAADYVRKMSEIPADVDQIVFQHHERPDGSGYPRSLSGKFISPLSAVFIIAHDIIEFMRLRPTEPIDVYLKENEELYHQGVFRKIWLSLNSDFKV